jgi:hypothetical protein
MQTRSNVDDLLEVGYAPTIHRDGALDGRDDTQVAHLLITSVLQERNLVLEEHAIGIWALRVLSKMGERLDAVSGADFGGREISERVDRRPSGERFREREPCAFEISATELLEPYFEVLARDFPGARIVIRARGRGCCQGGD